MAATNRKAGWHSSAHQSQPGQKPIGANQTEVRSSRVAPSINVDQFGLHKTERTPLKAEKGNTATGPI